MTTYAVVTGDIIGSSQLGPQRLEAAMALLRRLASEFQQIHPESIVGRPDVFRGDSWQICLQQPALVVTATVFLRAGFKADDLDTRIGIGWGTVERLNPDRISQSSGSAFTRSGQALDTLGKGQHLALARSGETADADSLPPVMLAGGVVLLDALLSRWTQRESVAVYGTLRKLPQEAIAELPQAKTKEDKSPTRQTIQDALRRVSWASHIQPFLLETEKAIAKVLV